MTWKTLCRIDELSGVRQLAESILHYRRTGPAQGFFIHYLAVFLVPAVFCG